MSKSNPPAWIRNCCVYCAALLSCARYRRVVIALECAGLLLQSCTDPLKGKTPYWYNGYVYGTQGYAFFAQGRLDLAITSYRKALAESQRYDIPQQSAQYMFNIGRCLYELDNYDSAAIYLMRAYDDFTLCKDSVAARRDAAFIALSLSGKGSHDSAMVWYKRATIVEGSKQDRPFFIFLHGKMMWDRDHRKEALTYFEEAFALYKKQKAFSAMAQMCYNQAEIYKFLADYLEAKRCIEESLIWGDKSELRFDRYRNVLFAASISACLGDSSSARWYYQRAKQCASPAVTIPAMESIMKCDR